MREEADAAADEFWAECERIEAGLELMAQDKKVKGGKLALVLARGIGEAFVERDVPMEALREFLKEECEAR